MSLAGYGVYGIECIPMAEVLRAKPVNTQVRHRGSFFPPSYNLVTTDVSVLLAGKLAQTFNLKSTGIIVNQNAMSTQYLSLRYILPNDPIRYLDASIGVDQAEIVFLNPATVGELKGEVGRVWNAILESLKPNITENYFEATLHCVTEGLNVRKFLNDLVNIQLDVPGGHKGISLTTKVADIDAEAKISLDVSGSVPDGLYVVFACVSKKNAKDMVSLEHLFEVTINTYRRMQSLAHIELLEPT